jgi:tRNA dimethylallyltransferase
MPTQSPLLVIVGPTAVGKTRLSLTLAQALNGEIISADSRYLYRGMDIGTDKPSPAERAAIPHHLIDVTNPGQTWALPEYQAAAQAAIAEITARGKLPLLVGGTGQYIRALLEGWVIPPLPEDPTLRDQLTARLAAEGLRTVMDRTAATRPGRHCLARPTQHPPTAARLGGLSGHWAAV